MEVQDWVIVAVLLVGGLVLLGARTGIKAAVEKSVAARFDSALEGVRSDLRMKEMKITALQSSILEGRAGRQAIIDKRRLEAIEKLWGAAVELGAFHMAASAMTVLKPEAFDQVGIEDNTNLQQFFQTLSGPGKPFEKLSGASVERERPFIPTYVWSIYEAYSGIMVYCYMLMSAAAQGLPNARKMLNDEKVVANIKTVMPHFADYLEKYGITGAAHLAGPVRNLLLEALRAALQGSDDDEKNLSEVVRIAESLDATLKRAVESAS